MSLEKTLLHEEDELLELCIPVVEFAAVPADQAAPPELSRCRRQSRQVSRRLQGESD